MSVLLYTLLTVALDIQLANLIYILFQQLQSVQGIKFHIRLQSQQLDGTKNSSNMQFQSNLSHNFLSLSVHSEISSVH